MKVAKGLKAPIKIVFPRDLLQDPFGPSMMLGLGDIVIPGIYVALALRFDLSQYHMRHKLLRYRPLWHRFAKPYFWMSFYAYIIGLAMTVLVMHKFQSAQPALLYLSPACVLSTLVTAWYRSEFTSMWTYKEAGSEKQEKKKEPGKKLR